MVVRRLLVVAVLPALFLASCGGEDPSPPEVSASVSPTPSSTSASVDPLAIPAEAREPTKAGAEALIRHYIDMTNHLWAEGDSGPVRKLFTSGCALCETPTRVVELAQAKGHTYEGSVEATKLSLFTIEKAKVPSELVSVDVKQTAIVERDSQDKVVNRFPAAKNGVWEFYVEFREGMWQIVKGESLR